MWPNEGSPGEPAMREWGECPVKRLRSAEHCIMQDLVDPAQDAGTGQVREDKPEWKQGDRNC